MVIGVILTFLNLDVSSNDNNDNNNKLIVVVFFIVLLFGYYFCQLCAGFIFSTLDSVR